jgi:mono/diheme cytochrome c family protein
MIKILREAPQKSEPSRTFPIDPKVHERGLAVYSRTCIACHGPDGKGVEGVFPPLLGSDWITGDKELPVRIILHGLMGPVEVGGKKYTNVMPPLGTTLSDQEIADVVTYVRQSWTNDASAVKEGEVARLRAQTSDRKTMYQAVDLHR